MQNIDFQLIMRHIDFFYKTPLSYRALSIENRIQTQN